MSGLEDTSGLAGVLRGEDTHALRAAANKIEALESTALGGRSPCQSPKFTRATTPMSLPSTAPSTPLRTCSLEGEFSFQRCYSGASTGLPDPVIEQDCEEEWDHLSERSLPPLASRPHHDVLEQKLAEVKELYRHKFGSDLDDEADSDSDSQADAFEYDAEGTPWVKFVGTGPLTVAVLEDSLQEVKQLYKAKFGKDLDEEDDNVQVDADGTTWLRTAGTGVLNVATLEDSLSEVKTLYQAAFGREVDEPLCDTAYGYDAEGTLWVGTTGLGPLITDGLEDELDHVKELYKEKFGRDVDDDDDEAFSELERDEDGTPWIKTVGTGPLTVTKLEEDLAEVKSLYAAAFGEDVDSPDAMCEQDADGTWWNKTVGTGVVTVDSLEEKLAEVRALFSAKFEPGQDFDEIEYDAEGTAWIQTVGSGPVSVDSLQDKLAEVKSLYLSRFGQDVDAADDVRDEDGTPWVKVVGEGPLTISVLEDKLAEVRRLYADKFGEDLDQDFEVDQDGTPWIKTEGTGPLTIQKLEESLAEVKELYAAAYGRGVDEKTDVPELVYDADGTLWTKTTGTGPLSISVLEDKLEEAKELYEERFGRFVEEDSDDEQPDLLIDQDGTRWFMWEGAGLA